MSRTIFVHNMFSLCSAKRRALDKELPLPCNYWLHDVKKAKEVFESIFDQRSP